MIGGLAVLCREMRVEARRVHIKERRHPRGDSGWQQCGDDREPLGAWPRRWKRAIRSGRFAISSGRILMAISRFPSEARAALRCAERARERDRSTAGVH